MYSCPHCDFHTIRHLNYRLHLKTCAYRNGRNYDVDADDDHPQMGGSKRARRSEKQTSALDGTFTSNIVEFTQPTDTYFEQELDDAFAQQSDYLRSQLAAKRAIKYSTSLKMQFHQTTDITYVTNPAIFLNTSASMLIESSNLEQDLSTHKTDLLHQIEQYSQNGSGWVVDALLALEIRVVEFR